MAAFGGTDDNAGIAGDVAMLAGEATHSIPEFTNVSGVAESVNLAMIPVLAVKALRRNMMRSGLTTRTGLRGSIPLTRCDSK